MLFVIARCQHRMDRQLILRWSLVAHFVPLRAMMEDSDRCMDSDCVNDISKATNSPQKKKRRLPEQHFGSVFGSPWAWGPLRYSAAS